MSSYPKPTKPEEMNTYFADAYNSGDVNRINALFEEAARVVQYGGSIVSGPTKINEEHLGLLKLGGKMTSINSYCIEIENIAMLRANWKIETKNEQGQDLIIEGSSAEVIRKQPDGTWLYIIDHPFGAM